MEKEYNDANWRDGAACKDKDPELFTADIGKGEVPDYTAQICGACAVRMACFTSAMNHNEQFGVWGGINFADRRLIYSFRKQDGYRRAS